VGAVRSAVPNEKLPVGCTNRFDFNFQSPADLEGFVAGQLRRAADDWDSGFYYGHHTTQVSAGMSSVSWGWSREQVLRLSHDGWPQVADKIRAAAFDLAGTLVHRYEQEAVEFDTSGAFVDVARFLDGVPDCMGNFVVAEQQGMSVTLVLDAFVSTRTGHDRVFRRGVAAAAVLLALESLGVAVSVLLREESTITGGTGPDGRDVGQRPLKTGVWLHRPGSTIDLSRLIVWLGHPGWVTLFLYDAEMLLTGGTGMYEPTAPAVMSRGIFVFPGFGTETFETDTGAEALLKSIMSTIL
jgi:hypothetical protein